MTTIIPPESVDNHGLNAKIQFHQLPDNEMKQAGFRMTQDKTKWYKFCTIAQDITFNVSIPINGGRGHIDILDECFCQPYDYQSILERNPNHPFANTIFNAVEKQMQKLSSCGIITGHTYGEYI